MKLVVWVPLLMIVAAAASAQEVSPNPTAFSSLRSQIRSDISESRLPGLSIAIARNGKILWEEGFGWADVERKLPATANTPFHVASVTKSITATAIMQLQERNKLHLDNPVNDYLGSAKVHSPMWDASEATVRRVLNHTSGLTTFARRCPPQDAGCDVDQQIERYGILVSPPGEVFDYSNLGYGILGKVIEKTSGRDLDSFFKHELFHPLHMNHCGLTLTPSIAKLAAARYDSKTHARSPSRISGHPGASSLQCSAHDLLLFGMFHLKEGLAAQPLLSPSAIDEMHQPQPNTRDRYGLGWWLRKQSGYSVISAQGGTRDSYALLQLVPSENLAIVVIANSYADFVANLGDKILASLLPNFVPNAAAAQPKKATNAVLPSPLAGKWSGSIFTFKGPANLLIEISPDGSVRGQVGEGPLESMAKSSLKPTRLYGQLPASSALPDAPSHGGIIEFYLSLKGNDLVGAGTTRTEGEEGDEFPHWVKLTRAQ